MTKVEKKPKIRFRGFAGEWKKKEFNELAEVRRGLTYKPTDIRDGGIRVLRSSNINEDQFVLKDDDIFVSEDAVNIDYVRGNDILITSANGSTRLVGKHAVINEVALNRMVHGGFMLLARAKEPYFLNASMGSNWYCKFINVYVAGGNGAIGNLSKTDLEAQELYVPLYLEQTQIGDFFKQIENLITLHQIKYDKLLNIKKSMFEKMFPKDGTDVPEVRFKRFTGSWKQCELGKVLTERKILQKISEDAPVLAFAAGQGVIDRSERKSNNRDHLTLDPTNKTYLLTEYNDIVYNPSNLKYGAIDRNKYGKGVISPIYVTFITEEEPSFIELIVKSEKFKLRALQYEEGTVVKRQSVKPENLLSLNVTISKSKEEQKKIGEYFEKFDKLITLHQREMEKLKNIKKACLEKMFI
ncbi:MAG: restriction endonuclease subunit S [Cetobacterium sp.]|uniref:restriction endonuclease subunit S n=1 Tax=Cetobacterium sp. TaxID=2071632 RepID=UPI003F2D9FED